MSEPITEPIAAVTLVVDDDPMVCRLAGRCLEQVGIRPIEALSAQQALEVLDEVTPELVILDVRMPGVDGLELCRKLRQRPDTGDVPILMMTGLDDPDTLEQAYEAGATDFITKPVVPTMLQHRARYLLRSGGAFRQLRRSQGRLAAAQRIAHLGNWQLDPEDGSLSWSDELFRVFRMEPRDRLNVADLLACVHPEDVGAVETFLRTAAEGHSPEPVQYRLRHEDGSITHVYQQAELGTDPARGSRWVFGTLQDDDELIAPQS